MPDPIPELDPPAPFPPLTIAFLAPAARVAQTGTAYTVQLDINHEVVESVALLGSWPQTNGHCKDQGRVRIKDLVFAPTIELRNLKPGRCYQVYVAAIDEDFNYSEAISPLIKILDVTPPTLAHRAPAPGRRHVDRDASVRVVFSEAVVIKGTPIVLRNARSGKLVAATLSWNAKTRTLTLDPRARLRAKTRYRVEVGVNVVDRGGNHLSPVHWGFVTGS